MLMQSFVAERSLFVQYPSSIGLAQSFTCFLYHLDKGLWSIMEESVWLWSQWMLFWKITMECVVLARLLFAVKVMPIYFIWMKVLDLVDIWTVGSIWGTVFLLPLLFNFLNGRHEWSSIGLIFQDLLLLVPALILKPPVY